MSGQPVQRRCVACRQLFDRRQLWRVVRLAGPGTGVVLDGGMGRSAYLCPNATCLEEARRHKRLQRGLRCPVADSIYTTLQKRLETGSDAHCAANAEAR